MAANETMGLTNVNKAVKMIKKEEIEVLIQDHTCPNKDHILGSNMHVMMQTLEGGDGPCLPHGLSVMNVYTEMTIRNKQIAVMMINLAAALITIAKGIKIAEVVAVNAVPQVEVVLGTLEKLKEIQGIQQTRMSVEWSRETLFQQLELSGLGSGLTKTKQLPKSYYLNIMTSFPWNLEIWALLS